MRLSIKVVILLLERIHSRSVDVVYVSFFLSMFFWGMQTLQDGNETVKDTISVPDFALLKCIIIQFLCFSVQSASMLYKVRKTKTRYTYDALLRGTQIEDTLLSPALTSVQSHQFLSMVSFQILIISCPLPVLLLHS